MTYEAHAEVNLRMGFYINVILLDCNGKFGYTYNINVIIRHKTCIIMCILRW